VIRGERSHPAYRADLFGAVHLSLDDACEAFLMLRDKGLVDVGCAEFILSLHGGATPRPVPI
jgi:hypothetical protein